MRKAIKWVILTLAVLFLAVVGKASWVLYPKWSNMRSEYITANVIRDLDSYVAAHPGEWPKSWRDLGDGSDWSSYTRFRFDLSVDFLLTQPNVIYQAVAPVSGQYYTYPHARSQLEDVLRMMRENYDISTRGLPVDANGG